MADEYKFVATFSRIYLSLINFESNKFTQMQHYLEEERRHTSFKTTVWNRVLSTNKSRVQLKTRGDVTLASSIHLKICWTVIHLQLLKPVFITIKSYDMQLTLCHNRWWPPSWPAQSSHTRSSFIRKQEITIAAFTPGYSWFHAPDYIVSTYLYTRRRKYFQNSSFL